MIGFTLDYGEGTIELFDEDCPYHLVRESHPRERYHGVAAVIYCLAEPVCPADDKDNVACRASGNLPVDDSSPFNGAVFLPVLVEQYDIVVRPYVLENQLSFLRLYLFPAQCGNLLELGNLHQSEVRVVPESVNINLHPTSHPIPVGLPDCQHSNFHAAKIINIPRILTVFIAISINAGKIIPQFSKNYFNNHRKNFSTIVGFLYLCIIKH